MYLSNGTNGYLWYCSHQPFVLVPFFLGLDSFLTLLTSAGCRDLSPSLKVGSTNGRLISLVPGKLTFNWRAPSMSHSIWNSPNWLVTASATTFLPFNKATGI